jgi:hypothetical protein
MRTIPRKFWLKPGEALARYPEYAANRAIATEKRHGRMLHATAYKCHACNKQARLYHHTSYLPGDRLAVVPLCDSCHRKANGRGLNVTYGVVPTHVGLIRIAIAGLEEA